MKTKVSHLSVYAIMIVAIVNLVISLGSVWTHNEARHQSYKLTELQGELYRAKMDETRLRLEVAYLSSPTRIVNVSLQGSKKEIDTK